MKQVKSISTSIVGFVLIVVVYFIVSSLGGDEPIVQSHYEASFVERVVDGDTIVATIDGKSVKVRLSGIDTPESVGDYKDKPEFYGVEASAYTEALLAGEKVYLEMDEKPYDRYDRLLAYVWLVPPESGVLSSDCINALLIIEGYATWFDDYDNTKYADDFEQFEKEARKMGLGLWR